METAEKKFESAPFNQCKAGEAALNPIHNLSLFTDEEITRYAASYVLIDPVKKVAVATDSRALVIVPIEDVQGEGPFLVLGKTLAHIFGIRKKIGDRRHSPVKVSSGEKVEVSTNTKHGELKFSHSQWQPDGDEKMFPRYEDVIPGEDSVVDISFSAKRLKAICEHALESHNEDYHEVRLRFRLTDSESAALVTLHKEDGWKVSPPLATYVLMPLTSSD